MLLAQARPAMINHHTSSVVTKQEKRGRGEGGRGGGRKGGREGGRGGSEPGIGVSYSEMQSPITT